MVTTHEAHLDDAEVVRVLDAQLDDVERTRVQQHLASCAQCARRLHQLDARQRRLTSLLLETDFDVPAAELPADVIDITAVHSRRRAPFVQRPWIRAAAGIVLLLGVALTMTPLQALVTNWLRTQWERISASEEVTVPVAPVPQQWVGPEITFTHDAANFRIDITRAQSSGTLVVRVATENEVTARASGAAVELLVLPGGLRIVNNNADAVNYEIRVPASVSSVRVTVGGRVVAELSAEQISAGAGIEVK